MLPTLPKRASLRIIFLPLQNQEVSIMASYQQLHHGHPSTPLDARTLCCALQFLSNSYSSCTIGVRCFLCRVKVAPPGNDHIWVFPKIMVPPNHPFLIGFSIINHPFWGTPIFGNIHIPHWERKIIFKNTLGGNMTVPRMVISSICQAKFMLCLRECCGVQDFTPCGWCLGSAWCMLFLFGFSWEHVLKEEMHALVAEHQLLGIEHRHAIFDVKIFIPPYKFNLQESS